MIGKSVIYDGACTLCIRSKNTLLALGLAEKDSVWAYQEMPDEYLNQVDYERFRNEMALIDLEGGDTLYGPEAISFLLSKNNWLLRFLFSIGPFYQLFSFIYKIIAFNRTAIMVPRLKKVRCASCEPDSPAEYRWLWIGGATAAGLLFSILLGIFTQNDLSKPSFYLGLPSLLFATYILLKKYRENYLEIAAHAASIFFMGMLLFSIIIRLMDEFGGGIPLSVWLALFAGVLVVIGQNYYIRSNFLQLNKLETNLGGLIMALIFLICYISLIF